MHERKQFAAALMVAAWTSGGALLLSAGATPVARTPWGHPDLQGTWNNSTITQFAGCH